METTSTQKKGAGGRWLKTDGLNGKKEISFTSILFLCAWEVVQIFPEERRENLQY